jgi:nicotinamidase/pyrazinamidase
MVNINFSQSALLVIDVQHDFCPGGTLAIADGDKVIDPLNKLARYFAENGSSVIATQDWHPHNHVSFASNHRGKHVGDSADLQVAPGQVLWPDHCIQGSKGAALHKLFDRGYVRLILRKGWRTDLDSYSGFFENDHATTTGLNGFLRETGIYHIFLGGLATEYCVLYTVLDACRLGYATTVLTDAIQGVSPQGAEKALQAMSDAGAAFALSKELLRTRHF